MPGLCDGSGLKCYRSGKLAILVYHWSFTIYNGDVNDIYGIQEAIFVGTKDATCRLIRQPCSVLSVLITT